MPESRSDRLKKTIKCIRTWREELRRCLRRYQRLLLDFSPYMEKTTHFFQCQTKKQAFCLLISEVMKIVIVLHQSGYRDFTTYYIHFVCCYLTNEFPELVSYTQMRKLMRGVLVPLFSYLTHCRTCLR